MDSLDLIYLKGKGTHDLTREKGKDPSHKGKRESTGRTIWAHFHLATPLRARTHDTKRFPGYGGACLKAISLPPTSDLIDYISLLPIAYYPSLLGGSAMPLTALCPDSVMPLLITLLNAFGLDCIRP